MYAKRNTKKVMINVYEEENSRNGKEEEVNKNKHENREKELRQKGKKNKQYIIYREKNKA